MATEYDWSRFVKRININAPAEQLYKAWVTRAGIESWFLRMGEFSEANGSLLQMIPRFKKEININGIGLATPMIQLNTAKS